MKVMNMLYLLYLSILILNEKKFDTNMTDVLLISENYLRSAFMISDNVQSKFILQAIKTSQEIYFQSIVGTCLYNILLDGVRNNTLNNSEL